MSGSSFYRNRNPLDFLNALDGARIPGGCEDCDAEQTVDATAAPIYQVTVHHDNTCPAYRAIQEEKR